MKKQVPCVSGFELHRTSSILLHLVWTTQQLLPPPPTSTSSLSLSLSLPLRKMYTLPYCKSSTEKLFLWKCITEYQISIQLVFQSPIKVRHLYKKNWQISKLAHLNQKYKNALENWLLGMWFFKDFFFEKAVFMTMVKQPQLYIGVFIDYMAGVNWWNFVFIIFN